MITGAFTIPGSFQSMANAMFALHVTHIMACAAVEKFLCANDKIGPAAPPIETKKGWLATVHCVDRDPTRGKRGWEDTWEKRYTAGLMLLDLHQPWKVIGLSAEPLLSPETDY